MIKFNDLVVFFIIIYGMFDESITMMRDKLDLLAFMNYFLERNEKKTHC